MRRFRRLGSVVALIAILGLVAVLGFMGASNAFAGEPTDSFALMQANTVTEEGHFQVSLDLDDLFGKAIALIIGVFVLLGIISHFSKKNRNNRAKMIVAAGKTGKGVAAEVERVREELITLEKEIKSFDRNFYGLDISAARTTWKQLTVEVERIATKANFLTGSEVSGKKTLASDGEVAEAYALVTSLGEFSSSIEDHLQWFVQVRAEADRAEDTATHLGREITSLRESLNGTKVQASQSRGGFESGALDRIFELVDASTGELNEAERSLGLVKLYLNSDSQMGMAIKVLREVGQSVHGARALEYRAGVLLDGALNPSEMAQNAVQALRGGLGYLRGSEGRVEAAGGLVEQVEGLLTRYEAEGVLESDPLALLLPLDEVARQLSECVRHVQSREYQHDSAARALPHLDYSVRTKVVKNLEIARQHLDVVGVEEATRWEDYSQRLDEISLIQDPVQRADMLVVLRKEVRTANRNLRTFLSVKNSVEWRYN